MMPPLPSVVGRRPQGVQASVQVGRRCLDVIVFALPGARLRGQHTAAVDILEVAVRELVPGLALLGHLVVDSEMPLCVFADPVSLDELVLPLGRGLMFAPFVPVVENVAAVLDQPPGIPVRGSFNVTVMPRTLHHRWVTPDRLHLMSSRRRRSRAGHFGPGAPLARVSYSFSVSRTLRGSPCTLTTRNPAHCRSASRLASTRAPTPLQSRNRSGPRSTTTSITPGRCSAVMRAHRNWFATAMSISPVARAGNAVVVDVPVDAKPPSQWFVGRGGHRRIPPQGQAPVDWQEYRCPVPVSQQISDRGLVTPRSSPYHDHYAVPASHAAAVRATAGTAAELPRSAGGLDGIPACAIERFTRRGQLVSRAARPTDNSVSSGPISFISASRA